jgi:hypothetical protein
MIRYRPFSQWMGKLKDVKWYWLLDGKSLSRYLILILKLCVYLCVQSMYKRLDQGVSFQFMHNTLLIFKTLKAFFASSLCSSLFYSPAKRLSFRILG